jgi:hypothetical protein
MGEVLCYRQHHIQPHLNPPATADQSETHSNSSVVLGDGLLLGSKTLSEVHIDKSEQSGLE